MIFSQLEFSDPVYLIWHVIVLLLTNAGQMETADPIPLKTNKTELLYSCTYLTLFPIQRCVNRICIRFNFPNIKIIFAWKAVIFD